MIRVAGETVARALLEESAAALTAAGVPDARQSAEWLLAAVLGAGRFAVYLDPGRELSAEQAERFVSLVARRAGREPLQYLLGFEEFHGLRLAVTPDALIPRPETEGLVEWAAETVGASTAAVVGDIGTGTGAIACALAARCPGLAALGTDCSALALAVAARNVRALGLGHRVRLAAGDLVEPLRAERVAAHLLVANLPYVPSDAIHRLPAEVAEWEPRQALDGGPDGLAVIRRLIAAAPGVLAPGGALLMEVGEGQAAPVAALLAAQGFLAIESRRDLNHVERYVGGRWGTPPRAPGGGRG